MSSVAETPVDRLCREADPASVVAFVADLYEARGWTVDRVRGRRLVVSDGDRTKTVSVVHPDDAIPARDLAAAAETVVTVDDAVVAAEDTEVLDADALGRQLSYAIDRPVAQRLLETHFGWQAQAEPPVTDPGSEDDVVTSDEPNDASSSPTDRRVQAAIEQFHAVTGRTRILVATLLMVALMGGVAIALSADGPSAGVGDEPTADVDTVDSVEVESTTPVPDSWQSVAQPGSSPETATPAGGPSDQQTYSGLPPGIDGTGTIDPRRLSETHRSVLENTSYRLTVSHQEFVDGRLSAIHSETIRVENATTYRASVTHLGPFLGTPRTIAEGDVYADGSARYELVNDSTVDRGVLLSYDRFLIDYVFHLYRQLNVRNSSVVAQNTEGDITTSYVRTVGNSDPRIENATGTIRVTENGLIERARWRYDISGTPSGNANVSIVFEVRVTDVGETTVSAPDWLNATG